MSDMSSFYGGKQGNSIVIAKRFDGINIPQVAGKYVYTRGLYAIDTNGDFIITQNSSISGAVGVGIPNGSGDYTYSTTDFLIKKTKDNYLGTGITNFGGWGGHDNDATQINSTTFVFYPVLAQGMVQFFAEGAKTASEVNYGAYVIIDTILNMASFNDPDNGKVYRRGMDINSTDGLAGAEYIGQIVGPQGESPEFDIDTFDIVSALTPHREEAYNPVNDGIIPGSYTVGGVRFYEDEIKYAWATIRDAFGNVTGCKLGFKVPTLVQDFEASSINPYTNRVPGTSGFNSQYTDLVIEDPTQYDSVTEKWQHPFFQKWQISVPQGYHGINPEDIEIVHSYTMTPEYKGDSIRIYNTPECDDTDYYKDVTAAGETYRILGTEYEFIDSSKSTYTDFDKIYDRYYMADGAEYDHDPSVISVKIAIDGGIKFVKKDDCYMDILRYHEVDFDNVEVGVKRYFYIGDYDTINRVTISDDGTLTVFYSAQAQPKDLEQILRWIDTKDSDGITIDDDGTVHVYYNTVHDPVGTVVDPYEKLDSKGRAHDHQDYPTVLDWVTEATLNKDGKFTILYNNNTVKIGEDPTTGAPIYGNKYETTLQWIDYVDFTSDGTVTFRWNTDNIHKDPANPDPTPAYQFNNQIKYIHDVQVENVKTDAADPRMNGYEGTGDQKIHVQYNNDGQLDHPIGVPLNYIIETCICTPSTSYPAAPYSHLLVYYADPDLRLKLKDKWVTYPSTKIIDSYIADPSDPTGTTMIPVYHVWTEWVDLGNARGESGGIHIIKNVSSLNDLKDALGNYIPPEKLTDASGTVINPDGAGWACSMDTAGSTSAKDILFYDYESKTWYSIGSIDSSSVDPSYIIAKGNPDASQMPDPTDVSTLKPNGFWFATERGYFAF